MLMASHWGLDTMPRDLQLQGSGLLGLVSNSIGCTPCQLDELGMVLQDCHPPPLIERAKLVSQLMSSSPGKESSGELQDNLAPN